MRRSVESSLMSGGLNDRRERCCRRPFAVRAGNQNRTEFLLWIAECVQQYAHVRQVEFMRRRTGQLVAEFVELLDSRSVGHAAGERRL